MDILNMCCPKKPKMSLDYIIKWIETEDKNIRTIEESLSNLTTAVQVLTDWKEQIEEDDLKTLFDTYAEEYDWSQVPVIGDIQSDVSELQQDLSSLETDVDSRLDARLEKPNMCILGNVPVWTSGNELDGTGKAIEGSAPSEDSEKLITSGAVYAGIHSYVPASISNAVWGVSVDEDGEVHIGSDYVVIGVDGGEAEITSDNIGNLNRALETPVAPSQGSDKLSTSGQIYTAISKKSDKEFCDKVYSRLMELEKNSSVEYGVTATYVYREAESNRPKLKINGMDIIYEYDSADSEITVLYNVSYLYELAFVGDVLVIKDLTTGTSIGTATVEGLITGPNRIVLSGLPLPNNSSYDGKSIEIAITHGNY